MERRFALAVVRGDVQPADAWISRRSVHSAAGTGKRYSGDYKSASRGAAETGDSKFSRWVSPAIPADDAEEADCRPFSPFAQTGRQAHGDAHCEERRRLRSSRDD